MKMKNSIARWKFQYFPIWKSFFGSIVWRLYGAIRLKRISKSVKSAQYIILFFIFFIIGCAHAQEPVKRGLFISMIEEPQVLESREQITKLLDFSKKAGIKTLFVQIYRSNQSWFPSTVSDSRLYESSVKSLAEDPVALLIEQAHKEGIQVHAWINLLSLGANKHAQILKRYGPDILTRNLEKKQTFEDYKIDNQYFLEPGDGRVRETLDTLVSEIVRRYPTLDGIQFDYIRYPDWHPKYGYTKANIDRFKKFAGVQKIDENSVEWKDWKRAQVTELLVMLAAKARLLNPKIQVSTTGCMPYSRAFAEAFQDWALWIDSGLIDFVTVMNYSASPKEFQEWNETIKAKVKDFSKVRIGVGAYKFVNSVQGFKEEWRSCQALGGRCAVFYYGSVRADPSIREFLEME